MKIIIAIDSYKGSLSSMEANKEGLFDRIIATTPAGMELSEAMKVEVAKKNAADAPIEE